MSEDSQSDDFYSPKRSLSKQNWIDGDTTRDTNLLCKAALNGDFDKVKELIEKGVCCKYCDHMNPVHYAIREKHYEIAKYLIDNGAVFINQRTERGETALSLTDFEDDDMIECLIDHGADPLMPLDVWQYLYTYDYEICNKVNDFAIQLIREKIAENRK